MAPPLARWDSGWYYKIALRGYSYSPTSLQNTVGFYPLYPLLMRAVAALTRAPVFQAGIAISLISLGGALWLLSDLVRKRGGEQDILFVVGSMLAFPAAFFFAACYTESLFLLATVATTWSANRRMWILCGVAGAAACLTRFNGCLIAIPIAAYAASSLRQRDKADFHGALGALAATFAGAVTFPIYLWYRWGDPLLYIHDKTRGWPSLEIGNPARFFTMLDSAIEGVFRNPGAGGKLLLGLELAALLMALLSLPVLLRGGWRPEGLYVVATLALLIASGNIDGIHRYVLVLFPCFVPVGGFLRRQPVAAWTYLLGGTSLGVILVTRFVHWMFVG